MNNCILRIRFYIPLLILFLTACTLPGPGNHSVSPIITPAWLQHRQAVEQISHYQVGGSLLYTSGTKKVYARFFLQQDSTQEYRLQLLTPLGSTELDLRVKDGMVQTINSKGQRYRSNDLEGTLYQLTGMALPLDSIRLWVLGLPGKSTQFQISTKNLLKSALLDANGKQWEVEYQNYDSDMTPPLPSQLEMNSGEQKIKLKIDNWSLT